jgi:hypothetical protein
MDLSGSTAVSSSAAARGFVALASADAVLIATVLAGAALDADSVDVASVAVVLMDAGAVSAGIAVSRGVAASLAAVTSAAAGSTAAVDFMAAVAGSTAAVDFTVAAVGSTVVAAATVVVDTGNFTELSIQDQETAGGLCCQPFFFSGIFQGQESDPDGFVRRSRKVL